MRSDDGGGGSDFRLELCGTAGVLTLWSSASRPDVALYPRPFVLPDAAGDWQTLLAPPRAGAPRTPPAPARCTRPTTSWPPPCWRRSRGAGRRSPAGRDGRAALEMILAVYASHLSGGRVALPLTDRAHPLTRGRGRGWRAGDAAGAGAVGGKREGGEEGATLSSIYRVALFGCRSRARRRPGR